MRTPEAVRMTEKQKAAFAPTPPFDAKEFSAKLVAFCEMHPDLKERALANGALRVRFEAQKPENQAKRVPLFALAAKLDEMSAEERVPPVDWLLNQISVTPMDAFDMAHMDVAASKVGPDGVPNSDLVAAFIQQKKLQDRESGATNILGDPATPQIQQAHINPASAIPGLTMFGNQALVQYGGVPSRGPSGQSGFASTGLSSLPEAQVVRWDGREQDATLVTLSVSRVLQGAGATFPAASDSSGFPLAYRPFAHILWGTSRAQPNEAYFDVGAGRQIVVCCAFLYLNVGMDPPGSLTGTYRNGSMVLAGQMGFFGNGRMTPVQRTVYVDALGPAAKQSNLVIPSFAVELAPIQISDIPTGQIQIDWKDVAGTILYSSQLLVPGSQVAPIPISDDVHFYDVTNNGSNTTNVRLMFNLSL